ncbi:MAG: endonuclease/exonuclease/phosphatase family protein [Steroidobacteraceae bacterium]|nr:endonuclease/exonuclease/phosphatase family protein [Steroidobacteraceae bacterium]MDW8259570.1 endonuclease/exonuclease/phosphatase family protein [Gammaproteobacteria bacterium]
MRRSFTVLLAALGCTVATAPPAPATDTLKLATWNLEWLIDPSELRRLERRCIRTGAPQPRGGGRFIPCDVAERFERSQADFAALARYASRLNADVVALQEVDGPQVARRLFPAHRFCFSGRRHVQNLGFAIRRSLAFRCDPDVVALSLGDRLRRGVQMTLFPGSPRELTLLTVHLKSGCARRDLDSGSEECELLADQALALEEWIDRQAGAGRRFAVLGDFNRELERDRGPARAADGRLRSLWSEIDDGDPPGADLTLAASFGRFRNCSMAQNFSGYIDHIVLGDLLAARVVPGSFERLTYSTEDALRRRLSDHCPVAIRVRLD